jgi:hypothetical protein
VRLEETEIKTIILYVEAVTFKSKQFWIVLQWM